MFCDNFNKIKTTNFKAFTIELTYHQLFSGIFQHYWQFQNFCSFFKHKMYIFWKTFLSIFKTQSRVSLQSEPCAQRERNFEQIVSVCGKDPKIYIDNQKKRLSIDMKDTKATK